MAAASKPVKVLSIDWDFFYPDSFPYDWGHREQVFFLEAIWPLRLNNRNLITGEEAFSVYKPTVPVDFWKRTIKQEEPVIFVAESHASILALPFKKAIITNLDAHHDCGYGNTIVVECGNWALMAKKRITEYHLCYPEWREIDGEGKPGRKPDSIIKGLPELSDYNYVFVCRSGCWTPPWYDQAFQGFLKQSGGHQVVLDEYAGKIRGGPNMAEAEVLKAQMDEQFKSLRERVA